jgi:hypothetical protein
MSMFARRQSKLKPEPEREHASERRRCLKCRELFLSDWPGERICPHCKAKEAWRGGGSWLSEA